MALLPRTMEQRHGEVKWFQKRGPENQKYGDSVCTLTPSIPYIALDTYRNRQNFCQYQSSVVGSSIGYVWIVGWISCSVLCKQNQKYQRQTQNAGQPA